ncbi:hypothetical protein B0H11DRAFT_1934526 [Mycena galericulata]|nr:hypothetical protein B0H11DRAFT_1934526 [Mycena galericulata]
MSGWGRRGDSQDSDSSSSSGVPTPPTFLILGRQYRVRCSSKICESGSESGNGIGAQLASRVESSAGAGIGATFTSQGGGAQAGEQDEMQAPPTYFVDAYRNRGVASGRRASRKCAGCKQECEWHVLQHDSLASHASALRPPPSALRPPSSALRPHSRLPPFLLYATPPPSCARPRPDPTPNRLGYNTNAGTLSPGAPCSTETAHRDEAARRVLVHFKSRKYFRVNKDYLRLYLSDQNLGIWLVASSIGLCQLTDNGVTSLRYLAFALNYDVAPTPGLA